MKKRLVAVFLIAAMLIPTVFTAGQALTREEQTDEVLADSRMHRYDAPRAAVVKSYGKLGMSSSGGRTITELSAGAKCTVLGECDEDCYIITEKGTAGYFQKKRLEIGDTLTFEDPGEWNAELTEQNIPYLLMYGYGVKAEEFTGIITSDAPITCVSVEMYNFRNMTEECGVYASFSAEDGVYTFDLASLRKQIPFDKLVPGDRYLTVTVYSGSGRKVLYNTVLCVSGNFRRQYSATGDCKFSVNDSYKEKLTDGSCLTGYRISTGSKGVTITFPKGMEMDSIQTEFIDIPHRVVFSFLDGDGNEVQRIEEENPGDFLVLSYDIPEGSTCVNISVTDEANTLSEVYVYEKGKKPIVAQRWEQLPDKVDILLMCTHRDDEYIYFGGILPWCIAQGKTVAVVYMTYPMLGRPAFTEDLNALWVGGQHYYPIFLGMKDERISMMENVEDWGGYDNIDRVVVEVIRKYKPDVVIGHDLDGEFGHYNHILTAHATVNAVEMAGDPQNFPESAEEYGVWDVPKFYMHLYDPDHRIMIPWDEPLENMMNLSARQIAHVGFEKHTTEAHQSEAYSLDTYGTKWDYSCFGLYRSLVGPDIENNDFFENLE